MKDLKEVEKLIINFGLSLREAKVYTTPFRKKDFTASELQQLVDIPRTKVYEVLHQLISKGMCTEKKIGRNKKYEATNPVSVFDKLFKDLAVKENIANNVLKILTSIYKQRDERDNPLDYIEVLKDKKRIHKREMSLQSEAKREILAFTKAPYTTPFSEDMNEEINLLKRKVNIRSIYEYKDVIKEELVKIISFWVSAGERAHIVEELPMKMVIFDEKITMFALNDPISLKPSITTMIINHPSFAKALRYVFESIWEKSMPFEEFKIKNEMDKKYRVKGIDPQQCKDIPINKTKIK
ncbi:MAG: helix-turn-helix domain-containing protein [Candidatus Celaenobacter polaris]|nr:helix-turn-helix domain-containing protein [Candidatus Celaenobacter polaris]